MMDESEFIELASTFGLFPLSPQNIPVAALRQVTDGCRYNNITAGLRQIFAGSTHKAWADLDWLRVGYANYYGFQEIFGASTLQVKVGLEYPIGNDNLQIFTFSLNEFGQISPGADILSDALSLGALIPKGQKFRIYTYMQSSASGIPVSYSGAQPYTNGTTQNSLNIQSGTNSSSLDYITTKTTAAARAALANTSSNNNINLTPLCIISNKSVRPLGLLGDSRGAGQSAVWPWNFDYVSDASLQQCILERVYGDLGPWINLAASSDYMGSFVGNFGSRRHGYLKYCTDIVNGFGTNDVGPATDLNALQALDASLAALKYIAGKPLYGMTIPPNTTSTNQFIDLAGQTLAASEAKRLAFNAWRLTKPAIYTGGVLDFAALVQDAATGKWKTGNGRAFTGSCTAGSASVSATANTFTSDDTGKTVFVTNGGASQNLLATANFVSATTITLTDKVTGLAYNASTTQTGVVAYIDCRRVTGDGLHETQYGDWQYLVLKPAALAAYNAFW